MFYRFYAKLDVARAATIQLRVRMASSVTLALARHAANSKRLSGTPFGSLEIAGKVKTQRPETLSATKTRDLC